MLLLAKWSANQKALLIYEKATKINFKVKNIKTQDLKTRVYVAEIMKKTEISKETSTKKACWSASNICISGNRKSLNYFSGTYYTTINYFSIPLLRTGIHLASTLAISNLAIHFSKKVQTTYSN